jgi:hypothetical protein
MLISSLNSTYRVLLCLLLVSSFSVTAEDSFNTQTGNVLQLGVDSEVGSIDNFLFDNTNERSSSYIKLAPKLFLQTQVEQHSLNLKAQTSHFKYQEFSSDDHSDFSINGEYQYKFSDNKALFFNAEMLNRYEHRGTGLSLGNADTLAKGDEKKDINFSSGYLFGQRDSVSQFKIELGVNSNEYITRRNETKILDKQSIYIKPSFDYLISGQSYLATEFVFNQLSFNYNPIQDKNKYVALAGIKWHSTAITELALLLGYQEIRFDQSTFADDNAFKWRVNVNWQPLYSTTINFNSGRDFQEANRLADSYRVVDNHQVNAQINFNDYWQASAGIGYKFEDIVFSNKVTSEDYLFTNFQLKYQRNEWLSLHILYIYSDLNAVETTLDYQRNSLSIGFSVNI